MIRTKRSNNTKQITGINITPFTDVCLVLLIIFMVTASALTKETSLNIKVPKTATMDVSLPSSVTVRVTRDQQYYVNNSKVTPDQLEGRLAAFRAKYKTELLKVQADQDVPYRVVMGVIDTARKAGIMGTGLVTQQTSETE